MMTIKPEHFQNMGSSRYIGWLVSIVLSGIVLLALLSADLRNRKAACLERENTEFIENECKVKE